MGFSLDSLKPKIVNIEIPAYGETHVIPVMPLSYTQYQNAIIGVDRPDPSDYTVRKLNSAGKMEDVLDAGNPEYLQELNTYTETIQMRRLAIALAGGGVEELQDKTLDEQVAIVREMDAGITGALIRWLEGEARHKLASRFQPVRNDGGKTPNQKG